MLGLAAGTEDTHLDPGERDILAVQLPPFSVHDMSGHYLAFFAFLGLRWMLKRMILSEGLEGVTDAVVRPLILNNSLGFLAGPKDGSGNFEREFSREVDAYEAATGGRVTAFFSYGNYYEERQVAVAHLRAGETAPLDWELEVDDPTASFIELRAVADFAVSVQHVLSGDQTPVMWPSPGTYEDIQLPYPGLAGRVYGGVSQRYNSGSDCALVSQNDGIVIALRPTTGDAAGKPGHWRINLHAAKQGAVVTCQIQSGGTPASYLGYIEHGRQSRFIVPQGSPLVDVTTQGCFSALVPVTDAKHRSVGAAAFVGRNGLVRPAPYASEGGLFAASSGPSGSSVVERASGKDGLWGLGTLSNTDQKIGGSSAAAAVATAAFARDIYLLCGRAARYDDYPGGVRGTSQGDARLGAFTLQ